MRIAYYSRQSYCRLISRDYIANILKITYIIEKKYFADILRIICLIRDSIVKTLRLL